SSTYLIDLRDTVRAFVADLPEPDEVWFFGSRAQETGSKRSDVDLLVIDREGDLTVAALLTWLRADREQRSPLDLFLSRDGKVADSVVNGSVLRSTESLVAMVSGVLLWSRTGGLVTDTGVPWVQEFHRGVDFKMTTIPTDFSSTLQQLPKELA